MLRAQAGGAGHRPPRDAAQARRPRRGADKVAYRLIDPRQYAGKRVLVVGGGDSALEAAIQLADESDAEVAISYRRPEFARCRPLNKQKIDAHLERGRITAFMSSEIVAIERRRGHPEERHDRRRSPTTTCSPAWAASCPTSS